MSNLNDSNNKRSNYEIRIDEQVFNLENPEPTGLDLLSLVGKTPGKFLLTLVIEGEPDRLIDPGETFDVSAPGVEHFALVSKARFYSFRIDEHSFSLENQFPTGRELLALVGKSPDTHLLTISLPGDDELIDADEKVDLAKPGREQFLVVVRNPLAITIDDVVYHPSAKVLTGTELRSLPTPPVATNRDLWLDVPGPDDRKIQSGEAVPLKDGMVFYTAPATINPGEGS